jgi:hypothetical protein
MNSSTKSKIQNVAFKGVVSGLVLLTAGAAVLFTSAAASVVSNTRAEAKEVS